MKHTLLFATIASFVVVHAYANNIVTSKTYVDNRDALKVDIAQGTGDNNANVGKTLVVNSSGNLELGTPAAANYVEDAITNDVTNKAPSENAVHDALAGKQDTIDTGLVSLGDGWIEDLPAVVSYDTTSGLVGNKYGILDYDGSADYVDDRWNNYTEDSETNHLIPTVGAVGRELQAIWDNIPSVTPITWNSNDATAVDNYSTSFTGTGNWPSVHEDQYVTGSSLAQGLALKQNKIPATEWQDDDDTPIPGVVISTDTDGVVEQRMILDKTQLIRDSSIANLVINGYDSTSNGGIAYDIHDNSVTGATVEEAVPTTMMTVAIANAAANQATSNKQNKLGGTVSGASTAGKVVTATGTAGDVTYTAIDSTPTSASTNLVTSGGVYTAVNAKQDVIQGYNSSTEHKSVLTDTTTDGVIGKMRLYDSSAADSDIWEDPEYYDNFIPTAGALGQVAAAAMNTKQNKLGGTGQNGKVVTATNTAGTVTYTATYDGSGTYNAQNDAGKIATAAAVETKQDKKTCAGWLDGTTVPDATHTDANCVLWNLPD